MPTGNLLKMQTQLGDVASYHLCLGDLRIPLNPLIGKRITLHHTGVINCIHCGRKTKKSFSQGYCYPCMMKLAECDTCIVRPETCHYDAGTCRDPEWADNHCMRPHFLYLANSSGIKVGITRETQIPTRWIDQGAVQALQIAKVQTRLQVGLMEVALKEHVNDKTNWRKMLKNEVEEQDLIAARDNLFKLCDKQIADLQKRFGEDAIVLLHDEKVVNLHFPVNSYPEKIKSHNMDKTPEVSGVLNGIKGQYLLLDSGVINIRKYGGYEVEFSSE